MDAVTPIRVVVSVPWVVAVLAALQLVRELLVTALWDGDGPRRPSGRADPSVHEGGG